MNRLTSLFEQVRAEQRTALLPFLTAGLPDGDSSVAMFEAMAEAGADAFEVGIPYSDPLMDGPTIQQGSARALAGGIGLAGGMEIARQVVSSTAKPVLVMTYSNVVFKTGPARFAAMAAEVGVSGVIVADLPLEESEPVQQALANVDVGMVLFVAPTSNDGRLERVAAARPVFIYGVAEMGVTGERQETGGHAIQLANRVRNATDLPLVMGVGISTPEQAAHIAPHADGLIVGSALVRQVIDSDSPDDARSRLNAAVAELAAALQ